jgi:tRNA and rRNA cytosine-C5-methylase
MELPSGFIEMMRRLIGDDADAFFLAMEKAPVVSVRLNGRKPSDAFDGCRAVKWCRQGRYLESRPIFTLDPLLHAGAYYVQDASSMIHYETVKRILASLAGNVEENAYDMPLSVLDLCAAPGGKTTAMIDALPDGSRIVANEYVGKRAAILKENLTKWGYPNIAVTNRDSSWFAAGGDSFDVVAVDAPCSGEGMMRKDPDAVAQWSPQLIAQCATLQREILGNAVKALKPGGFLIYSTCTFNTEENERNAEFIKDELGLESFDPGFPKEWDIPGGIGTSLPVYRFMPHKTEGEGLFLAVFRKPGEFEPSNLSRTVAPYPTFQRRETAVSKKGGRKEKGVKPVVGKKETQDIPEMEEILSVAFDRSRYPLAELTKEQAVAYLRRESVVLSADVPKGIAIVTYKGLPLGPVKNIGTRANNLYPKTWRILIQP